MRSHIFNLVETCLTVRFCGLLLVDDTLSIMGTQLRLYISTVIDAMLCLWKCSHWHIMGGLFCASDTVDSSGRRGYFVTLCFCFGSYCHIIPTSQIEQVQQANWKMNVL
jgi:hypothetical protein